MKCLLGDKLANVDMILTAVVAAIVFAISIAIIYAVLGGLDYYAYDINFGSQGLGNYANQVNGSTPALNASNNLMTNMNTFYNLGPIYIVVIAAVGIIAAVLMVRGRQ